MYAVHSYNTYAQVFKASFGRRRRKKKKKQYITLRTARNFVVNVNNNETIVTIISTDLFG